MHENVMFSSMLAPSHANSELATAKTLPLMTARALPSVSICDARRAERWELLLGKSVIASGAERSLHATVQISKEIDKR